MRSACTAHCARYLAEAPHGFLAFAKPKSFRRAPATHRVLPAMPHLVEFWTDFPTTTKSAAMNTIQIDPETVTVWWQRNSFLTQVQAPEENSVLLARAPDLA